MAIMQGGGAAGGGGGGYDPMTDNVAAGRLHGNRIGGVNALAAIQQQGGWPNMMSAFGGHPGAGGGGMMSALGGQPGAGSGGGGMGGVGGALVGGNPGGQPGSVGAGIAGGYGGGQQGAGSQADPAQTQGMGGGPIGYMHPHYQGLPMPHQLWRGGY